ncbi:MAG: hypothetical protein PHX07_07155 [Candidatus Marinimicrobia bacterium]|nr:hypothetical protein [Candidatus Neomarinimicrobiota bacterium]MDD4961999.1 hypothetical protein [Candidatus Neomarinimicrobiota bacterium]MDD5710087.1 hypothetical protein [Candidatus Neomarinimicrobiota bacterium]MDX9778328.1 hypothetical protein [bacterium]
MSNQKNRLIISLLTLVALALILAGLAMEQYLLSLLGFVLLLGMLIQRGWQIRKLNKQIKTMKDVKHDHNNAQDQ